MHRAGSEFQSCGPATEKPRRLYSVWIDGVIRSSRSAERSFQRPGIELDYRHRSINLLSRLIMRGADQAVTYKQAEFVISTLSDW